VIGNVAASLLTFSIPRESQRVHKVYQRKRDTTPDPFPYVAICVWVFFESREMLGIMPCRHLLTLNVHIRIPAFEDGTQLPVERLHARLQQQMRTGFGPLHLLFFTEAFARDLMHRGFHKTRRDRLALMISLPVIRDHVPVAPDIRAQHRERLAQGSEPGIRLAEGRDGCLQVIDLAERFVDLPMPQRPFQTFDLLPYPLTQHGLTLHQAFAILLQRRQLHREMKPVQNMRGLWAHLTLELTKRVIAIGEKGNLLVHLQALRVQYFIQASFRLRLQRLHKTKAFAGGGLVFFLLSKGTRTLTNNDLEVVLFREPVAHVSPVNAHLECPIRAR